MGKELGSRMEMCIQESSRTIKRTDMGISFGQVETSMKGPFSRTSSMGKDA